MRTATVIVAAGRGTRAQRSGGAPKQYVALGGMSVLRRTLEAFEGVGDVVVVVIHPDDAADYAAAVSGLDNPPALVVTGGATRQASVRAGLEALAHAPPERVLIHDAARPFPNRDLIERVIAALSHAVGAVPALPLADTLKRADDAGRISATVPRDGLWRAQTPQGFRFEAILEAHRAAVAAGRIDFTDDAAVAEWHGLSSIVVAGCPLNIKLTTAEDFVMAERALAAGGSVDVRTGTGFDVHRFRDGDHVWLGGVRISHSHGLEGHSDADVALHALTDAVLGAIAEGDIGQHFPPSDPQWKGAASHQFLTFAAQRVRDRGGRITNVDLTLLCESPRIGPHRDAMRRSIADMLALDMGRVAVKATTTEGLGFTGRREGIAAMATATVVLSGD